FPDEVAGEIVAGIERFDVVGAAEFLGYSQDLTVFGLGCGVVTLVKERVSETAMAAHGKSVVGTESSRLELDQFTEHPFSIMVGFVGHQGVRQAVSIQERIWMLRAKDFFFEGDDFAVLGGWLR